MSIYERTDSLFRKVLGSDRRLIDDVPLHSSHGPDNEVARSAQILVPPPRDPRDTTRYTAVVRDEYGAVLAQASLAACSYGYAYIVDTDAPRSLDFEAAAEVASLNPSLKIGTAKDSTSSMTMWVRAAGIQILSCRSSSPVRLT